MIAHADAIAQKRPAGERAGRIDRQNANLPFPPAKRFSQAGHERALSRSGTASDAQDARAAGARVKALEDLARRRIAIVDQGERPRRRSLIAAQDRG